MAIFEKETKTIVGYGTTLSFPISHNMPATSYILSVSICNNGPVS